MDSLRGACRGLSWRVSVVDNSAEGQDVHEALASVPTAVVIRSAGRRGFGANQNLVLDGVLADGRARYVLILNDDTELDPDAVVSLVRHADAQSRAGIVSPRIRDSAGRVEPSFLPWPSVGDEVMRAARPRMPPRLQLRSGWTNGACLLARTDALRQVGVFDTSFFLFFEDADLCRRLAAAGWTLELCDAAAVVHHGHQTITREDLKVEVEKQLLRSRYLYFRKHHGRARARAVTELVRCVLVLRAITRLAEAGGRGSGSAGARARDLWALARSMPSRPTMLERDAERGRPHAAPSETRATRWPA
jgi:GT2 family glycosyltransferase